MTIHMTCIFYLPLYGMSLYNVDENLFNHFIQWQQQQQIRKYSTTEKDTGNICSDRKCLKFSNKNNK